MAHLYRVPRPSRRRAENNRMRWSSILLILLALGSLPALADPAEDGPHRYSEFEYELLDESRGRTVLTRVTLPSGDGPFPLVLLSHGLGGNKNTHNSIVRHLASHGYLVFVPEHPRSNTTYSRKVYARNSGPLTKRALLSQSQVALDPKSVLQRPRDLSFLIDQAEIWNRQDGHPLRGRVDLDKIAAAGHSFGAYTVLTACGARPILDHIKPAVAPGSGLAPSLADPRIDVGVAYSPQGPGNGWFSESSFSDIRRPMLLFSGSRDKQGNFVARGTLPAKNRYRAFELMPEGDKYFLWLRNAGHMAWVDFESNSGIGQFGARLAVPENKDVLRISKAMTVVFLDAYLKGSKQAKSQLREDYAKTLSGRVVRRLRWAQK